ncbi:hypothetical protein QR504_25865, partial [Escherichia coli]|uniref:hypothetical protein n=1 Tax=Escherichia coli TaxID=562 RepID=UPI0027399BBD
LGAAGINDVPATPVPVPVPVPFPVAPVHVPVHAPVPVVAASAARDATIDHFLAASPAAALQLVDQLLEVEVQNIMDLLEA